MPAALEILPAAPDKAESAAAWYAERSTPAAGAFADELDVALKNIAEAPRRWPAYLHGTRRVVLRRFPYLVVYRERPGRVLVVAVAHGHRKPGYWRDL